MGCRPLEEGSGSLGEDSLGREWQELWNSHVLHPAEGQCLTQEALLTKFSSLKHQNCPGRLPTMGIRRAPPTF